MVNIEIIVGLLVVVIFGALIIPLAFDPRGIFDLTDLSVCDQGEVLIFDETSGLFICVDIGDVTTITQLNRTSILQISQFDNFEWARASDFNTQGANAPQLQIDTLTNFNVDVIRYQVNRDPNQAAFWTSAIPTAFNSTNAILDADLYYYKPLLGNNGTVCWGLSWIGIENGTNIDETFGVQKGKCVGQDLNIDTLEVINFQFNSTEHDLAGREWAVLRLERTTTLLPDGDLNPDDTFDKDAFLLGVRIIWESLSNQTTGM